MRIKIYGAPTCYGTNRSGCEEAPGKLRDLDVKEIIAKYFKVIEDYGDVFQSEVENEIKRTNLNSPGIINSEKLLAFNTLLARKAREITDEEGEDFVLFLGGDHSISIGSISGLLEKRPNTAVVWFDAHCDLNTVESSPSQKAHGMAASALLNETASCALLCNPLQKELPFEPLLKRENIFFIGQRWFELDVAERKSIGENKGREVNLDKRRIFLRTSDEIREYGAQRVFSDIENALNGKGIEHIHLSFDIDVLNKWLVPQTGTPVPRGLDEYMTRAILRKLAESGKLRSMDFVEFNPTLPDRDGVTVKMVLGVFEEIFANLK